MSADCFGIMNIYENMAIKILFSIVLHYNAQRGDERKGYLKISLESPLKRIVGVESKAKLLFTYHYSTDILLSMN